MVLRVAQCIADTEAEGPGRRFALWVQGCSLRCPGCCNPEMFAAEHGTATEVEALVAQALATPGLEGVSVLGGEPFQQAEAVAAFCRGVRAGGLSVMVFSGYTLEELRAREASVPGTAPLLALIDVLVDGRYERARPEHRRRWVGSSNQRVLHLTPRYRDDDPRFGSPNTVELRLTGGTLTVNGWPAASDAARPGAKP